MEKDVNNTESRRKFLKTAGKFAVYTPPALMIMSKVNANTMHESCLTNDIAWCDQDTV